MMLGGNGYVIVIDCAGEKNWVGIPASRATFETSTRKPSAIACERVVAKRFITTALDITFESGEKGAIFCKHKSHLSPCCALFPVFQYKSTQLKKVYKKTHKRERGNPFSSCDGEISILDRAIKLRNRNQQPTVWPGTDAFST